MRLVVVGATGRTGGEIVAEAVDRGYDVAGVARSSGSVGEVRVHPVEDLPELLAGAGAEPRPDAAVDFTTASATREHAGIVADAGVPYVVGTTGFDAGGLSDLRAASESVPVLKAANFARGVQALLRVVEAGVEALPDYDVELTETHHSGKRDAPSGTANTILDAVDAARTGDAGSDGGQRGGDGGQRGGGDGDGGSLERVHGRRGEHRRGDDEVGVHVRRAGTVRGEHELLLAGNDEVLTLTHRAESRRVFAAGAVDAAEWLADREAGWYDFADVL